ncbi:MAG: DUF1684 domain-containing protein [Candidatus Eisenbacteria bacterium]|mgnify:CR=1 FL=1|nr:DUF1684 domain-containing protein [Candidatus Eisenbacteria bacterium]
MKRLVSLFLLITILVVAIVVAIRVRTGAAPSGQPLDPRVLPIAPDLDSLPADSVWFGQVLHDRREQVDSFRGPDSPLEDRDRTDFQGLSHWPPDPTWRFTLRLEPFARPDSVVLLDTKGKERTFLRAGRFRFQVAGREQFLTLYRQTYQNYWFLPFRDATAGSETYEVGRYVEPRELGEGRFEVDFNRAYNPYCAYSHRWACPIPPAENRLAIPIRAGEKIFHPASKN